MFMAELLQVIMYGLDVLYKDVMFPIVVSISRGAEMLFLHPLRVLQVPVELQVVCVGIIAAFFSILIRKWLHVDQKERAFKERFVSRKEEQSELKLIQDWKTRETLIKVVDDDIDEDFNTYLAGRFSRYGIIYLLPSLLSSVGLMSVLKNRLRLRLLHQTAVSLSQPRLFFLVPIVRCWQAPFLSGGNARITRGQGWLLLNDNDSRCLQTAD